MTARLPDLVFVYKDGDEDGLADALELAILQVEKNTRLAVHLHSKDLEDYYLISAQIKQQLQVVRKHIRKLGDKDDRRYYYRAFDRIAAVISFLDEFGPLALPSSGVSGRTSSNIRSVRSSGLPGLGKRR